MEFVKDKKYTLKKEINVGGYDSLNGTIFPADTIFVYIEHEGGLVNFRLFGTNVIVGLDNYPGDWNFDEIFKPVE